jgi:hypothetical protein
VGSIIEKVSASASAVRFAVPSERLYSLRKREAMERSKHTWALNCTMEPWTVGMNEKSSRTRELSKLGSRLVRRQLIRVFMQKSVFYLISTIHHR